MIAVRRLPRAEWESELRDYYGCNPLEGKGPLNVAELWQMPWDRVPFTVNVDDDGSITMGEMDRIQILMASSRPPGIKLPYDPSNPTGLKLV